MKKEELIISPQGGFNFSKWEIKGIQYTVIGSKSVGYKALDTIDTIKSSKGGTYKILRSKLVGKKAMRI